MVTRRPSAFLLTWLMLVGTSILMMSAVTFAELEYGVAASPNPKRERKNLASLIEDIPVMAFK